MKSAIVRRGTLSVSLFLYLFIIYAQDNYVGIIGGAHANGAYVEHSLRGNEYNTVFVQRPIIGFHSGLQYRHYNEIKSFRKLHTGIQVSAFYIQRGWQQAYLLTTGPITRMNYLHIPVEALIFMGTSRNRFYLSLGIFGERLIDYSLGTEPIPDLTFQEDFYTYDPDRGDYEFGYGFNAGLGWHATYGRQSFILSSFLSYALSDFIHTDRISDPTPDVSNLWSAGLRLGYFIPINNR
jgi:hypothetical protein